MHTSNTSDTRREGERIHAVRTARLAVTLCFLLNGALFACWVSRIPTIQGRLGLSHGALGLVLFAVALGALVSMPLAGRYASRHGSRGLTRFVALVYCASLPLLAFAPNAVLLAVALFVFGAFHGAFDVAMNAQAVSVERRYERPIMSSFHALWSLGGLLGAGLGAAAAAMAVAPATHFVVGTLALGGVTLFVALPRLLDDKEAQRRELHLASQERTGINLPPLRLVGLGAVAFCIMMGEGAMADWSAVFLSNSAGASEALAAAGYAAFSVAMAATRFSGDWLSTRIGPVRLVQVGSGLAAAGMVFALAAAQPMASLLGFAAVGAGFATIVPQVFSAAGRVSGMGSGSALAFAATLGYTGFLVGPPLIGGLAEVVGLRGSLGVVAGASLLPILLAGTLRRDREAKGDAALPAEPAPRERAA